MANIGDTLDLPVWHNTCRVKSQMRLVVQLDPQTQKPEAVGTCPNCNNEVVYYL